MVKADLSRDYYGDLDLLPNADANDIKKQFKKLGMIPFYFLFIFLITLDL